jgi:hypothetical protein
MDPAFLQDLAGERCEDRVSKSPQGVADRSRIVFRKEARIGSRIGERLVLLVERLGDGQRVLGAEAEAAVGLALEGGEVKEERRELRGGLALLGDGARLPEALGPDTFGPGLFP